MLDLLYQDRLFADQVVLLSRIGTGIGDFGYQASMLFVAIVQPARVYPNCRSFRPHKVEFIAMLEKQNQCEGPTEPHKPKPASSWRQPW